MTGRVRRGLCDWLAVRGAGYLRAEHGVLALLAAGLTGGHAVQVGVEEQSLIDDLTMVAQHVLTVDGSDGLRGSLEGRAAHWPLQDESVGLVVVHHAHEVIDQGESLFREAARVLRPRGNLVVFGFDNRGLPRAFPADTASGMNRVSAKTLQHRLDQIGLERVACHAVIAGQGRWPSTLRWMDGRADCGDWLATLSGGYGLRARKRDSGAPIFGRRDFKGRAMNGAVSGSPAGGV